MRPALSLALVHVALAGSDCPAGVQPGAFYPGASQVWKRGGAASRCDGSQLQILSGSSGPSPADLTCAALTDNATAVCTYSPMEFGGYWCPLATASNSTCTLAPGAGGCFEDSTCFDEYGVCRCVQCPCGNERRRGQSCNVCDPANCDDACRRSGMLRPGLEASCNFGPAFYEGPLFALLFNWKMAQPVIEFKLQPEGKFLVAQVTVYYSLCTEKERVLVNATFTGCEVGVKETCLARKIPTPCLVCDGARGVEVPPNSFLVGTPSEQVFRSIDRAALLFGCEYGVCNFFLEAVPLDFGKLSCSFGTACADENSTTGESLGAMVMKNDAAAAAGYVVWLAAIAVGLLVIAGIVVILAALYQFKAVPEPMPLDGAAISWDGLGLNDIIQDLSGGARPCQFVAILGTIGAGKSTLLKVLAGRLQATQGSVLLNGCEVSDSELRRAVGFVQQEAVCCVRDTVAEAIGFAATMCGGKFPEIGALMEKAESRIGTLSGGQRRLVDVYVELARRPSVLLLDEPTTGLDSDTALVLGRVLKEISKSIPVIATLHQPRPELAELLTDVLILRGGKLVCQAGISMGQPSAAVGLKMIIFAKLNMVVPRTAVFDYAVDLASGGVVLTPERDPNTQTPSQHAGRVPSKLLRTLNGAQEMVKVRQMPLIIKQIVFLLIRNTKRSLRFGPWKYLVTLIICVIMGWSYFQVEKNIAGMRNRFGALFLCHAFLALQGISATSEQVEVQNLVEHETASHVYSRRVDALVRVLSQFAGQLPHALILSVVVYPMVGLRTDGARPVIFTLCMMATAVASACIALLCRGRLPSTAGVVAAAALNGGLVFFCGAFTNSKEVPAFMQFLIDISPFRYSFEVVIAHEFIGLQSDLKPVDAEIGAKPLSATGEFYLDALSLPYRMDADFYMRCKLVGVMAAVWVAISFIVLSLPSCSCLRATTGMRRSKAGEVNVQRLSEVAGLAAVPGHPLPAGAAEAAESQQGGQQPQQGAAAPPSNEAIGIGVQAEAPQQGRVDVCQQDGEGIMGSSIAAVEVVWSGLTNRDVSGLTGGMRTGDLLGIVGPCGSGKTTLLKMLAGRVRPSSGTVRINGQQVTPKQLAGVIGFVPQEDWMCPEDTVSEALAFAGDSGALGEGTGVHRGSLVEKVSFGQQAQAVHQRLGLLSPGQRRLTAVCAELARRPLIMALDEPTSGLDTASSMRLAELLKSTSARLPVVMTLHQPRPELQGLLTHVLIMRRGQMAVFMPFPELLRVMYPDPQDSVVRGAPQGLGVPEEDAEAASIPRSEKAILQGNVMNKPGEEQQGNEAVKSKIEVTEVYASPVDRALEHLDSLLGEQFVRSFDPAEGLAPVKIKRARPPVTRVAARVLARAFRRTWLRRPRHALGMVLVWGLAALILGAALNGQLEKNTKGIIARLGVFFAINSLIGILTLPCIYEFGAVKVSAVHELESQVCSPIVYHLCQTLTSCTDRLPCSLVFSLVFMGFVPLNPDLGHQNLYFLLVFLTALLCSLLAHALSSLLSGTNAVNAYNGILVFMLVFGTSFMAIDPNEEVPASSRVVKSLARASFFSYAYEAQVENELAGQHGFAFELSGIALADLSGKQWLRQLGIPHFLVGNIVLLIAWAVLLWGIGALGLALSIRPSRRAAVGA